MTRSEKDYFQYGLGAIIVLGFFILLGMMLVMDIPVANEKAFGIMLGILSASVGAVIGYFYGSSKGSSEKNDIIAGVPK